MPSVATRSTARRHVEPVKKMWKQGFSNQAIKQTAGFYSVHMHHSFNHIWLGTDPDEADALINDMNECIRLINSK